MGVSVAVGACALPAMPVATPGTGGAPRRPAAKMTQHCRPPDATDDFQRAAPAAVDLNPNAVNDALGYATSNLAASVRIYRHDCLVATSVADVDTEAVPAGLWSATKGVVGMLVGRAVTLGKLSVDDPIGRWFPEADAAHRAITVRELLQQSSGLTFHWANDVAAGGIDSINFTLGLPFEHAPGTYFEYAQTTVSLLVATIERATGTDIQTFADAQLFSPLGIPRQRWSWARDQFGHSFGYAFLSMAPLDLARLGTLLLHRGQWAGRQLIDADYVAAMSTPSATNPGYGYLVWTNAGDWFITPSALVRKVKDRPWIASAPRDTYALSGMFDQLVWVIPSLDMVVVRTGFFGASNWQHQFFRILMKGVRDVSVPDPGALAPEPVADLSEWGSLIDLATWPGLVQPR